MNEKVLLLNQSNEFLGVTTWQDAVGDIVIGKVVALENYDRIIRSQYLDLPVPAVVREIAYVTTAKFEKIFRISHTTRNVFIRDHFFCQYCGKECSRKRYSQGELQRRPKLYKELPEMDHVIPRSKGGGNTWENTVTACRSCNGRKAARMLSDTDMKLRSVPGKPHGFREIFEMKIGQIEDCWRKYLEIYF